MCLPIFSLKYFHLVFKAQFWSLYRFPISPLTTKVNFISSDLFIWRKFSYRGGRVDNRKSLIWGCGQDKYLESCQFHKTLMECCINTRVIWNLSNWKSLFMPYSMSYFKKACNNWIDFEKMTKFASCILCLQNWLF